MRCNKVLILYTYQQDSLCLRQQECEDPWIFFEARKGFGSREAWETLIIGNKRQMAEELHKINPVTPELNPSAQRCEPRLFTGDFNFIGLTSPDIFISRSALKG
jgi:hypothetical protein